MSRLREKRWEKHARPGYTAIPMGMDETTETAATAATDPDSVRGASRGLFWGLGLIAFSFVMSGGAAIEGCWAGGEEACGHHARAVFWGMQAAYLYGASWIMLGIGVLIGGKPAYSMFVAYRKRVINKLLMRKS